MRIHIAAVCITMLLEPLAGFTQTNPNREAEIIIRETEKILDSQWNGKRVAFFGDSMTQPRGESNPVYWENLAELLGIEPFVYGISGHQWDDVYGQALKLNKERGDEIDAILIFAGTNDYNHGVPMGEFFQETTKETNHNGKLVTRKYRTPLINDSTFCGRINKVMSYLKANYPQQQIIIMTPIHRGFARFRETNVQPEESFCNGRGLYLDAYVDALRDASSIWAVPLIDLYTISGLYPLVDAQVRYFRNGEKDRLHPSNEGNYRLAKTIQYQLLALPATFRVGE